MSTPLHKGDGAGGGGVERYPEHAKLSKISDESQAVGHFLDVGLPQMGMFISERIARDCECRWCELREGAGSRWHTAEEKATIEKGRVQVTEYRPTHRTVKSILAEFFDIDQEKLEAEKRQMLADIRGDHQ